MIWIFSDIYHPAISGVPVTVDYLVDTITQAGLPVGLVTVGSPTPNGGPAKLHISLRTQDNVTFAGDQLARFSAVSLARRIPGTSRDVFVLATPGRVGMTGLALARRRGRPSVMLHLTDAIRYAAYYPALKPVAYAAPKAAYLFGSALIGVCLGRTRRPPLLPRTTRQAVPAAGERFPAAVTAALRIVYGFADLVVTLTDKSRQDLLAAGVPAFRVMVIPSGFSIPEQWDRPIPAAPVQKQRQRSFRLLYVGRLVPEKNIDLLLDAMWLLRSSATPATLTLVGQGHDQTRLRGRAAALGLSDVVSFSGAIPRQNLGSFYTDADLFVFPSLTDVQSLATYEAAWFRLPALIVDPYAPILAASGAALLTRPDPAAVASRILDLSQRPDVLAAVAANAGDAVDALAAKTKADWLGLMDQLANGVHR